MRQMEDEARASDSVPDFAALLGQTKQLLVLTRAVPPCVSTGNEVLAISSGFRKRLAALVSKVEKVQFQWKNCTLAYVSPPRSFNGVFATTACDLPQPDPAKQQILLALADTIAKETFGRIVATYYCFDGCSPALVVVTKVAWYAVRLLYFDGTAAAANVKILKEQFTFQSSAITYAKQMVEQHSWKGTEALLESLVLTADAMPCPSSQRSVHKRRVSIGADEVEGSGEWQGYVKGLFYSSFQRDKRQPAEPPVWGSTVVNGSIASKLIGILLSRAVVETEILYCRGLIERPALCGLQQNMPPDGGLPEPPLQTCPHNLDGARGEGYPSSEEMHASDLLPSIAALCGLLLTMEQRMNHGSWGGLCLVSGITPTLTLANSPPMFRNLLFLGLSLQLNLEAEQVSLENVVRAMLGSGTTTLSDAEQLVINSLAEIAAEIVRLPGYNEVRDECAHQIALSPALNGGTRLSVSTARIFIWPRMCKDGSGMFDGQWISVDLAEPLLDPATAAMHAIRGAAARMAHGGDPSQVRLFSISGVELHTIEDVHAVQGRVCFTQPEPTPLGLHSRVAPVQEVPSEQSGMSCFECSSVKKKKKKKTIRHPPGPPLPALDPRGHYALLKDLPSRDAALDAMVNQYGRIVKLVLLSKSVYIIREPNWITTVLDRRNKGLPHTEVAGGHNGLFFADGERHKCLRQTLNPCFYKSAFEHFTPRFVEKADEMLDGIRDELSLGAAHFDIFAWSERLFYDSMCDVGFGYKAGILQSNDKPPILELFDFIYEEEKDRAFRPAFLNDLPTSSNNKFRAAVVEINKLVDEIIDTRQKEIRAGADVPNDVLALLLQAKTHANETMPTAMIRAQILNFLRAGTDTTASCLTWTLYCISQNPAVEAQVLREMDTVFGSNTVQKATTEELMSLKYLDLVVRETMRIHPPALVLIRSLDEQITLGNFDLEKDSWVMVDICGLHMDPEYWDEPFQFRPERHTKEGREAQIQGQFIPFGGGKRTCIGNLFGVLEVKATLSVIYRQHVMRTTQQVVQLSKEPNRPLNGVEMTIHKRFVSDPVPRAQLIRRLPSVEYALPESIIRPLQRLPTPPRSNWSIAIVYGSNNGMSEDFAAQISAQGKQLGLRCTLAALDSDTGMSLLQPGAHQPDVTLIITSTYNGEPPQNAQEFVNQLNNQDAASLSSMTYAVLGVGDSNWSVTFQRIPRFIDRRISDCGACRLLPLTGADVEDNAQRALDTWARLVWQAFGAQIGEDLISSFSGSQMSQPQSSQLVANFEIQEAEADVNVVRIPELMVRYGSQQGTCKSLAIKLANAAISRGWKASVGPLDMCVDGSELGAASGALFVALCATYNGASILHLLFAHIQVDQIEGQAAENAAKFSSYLSQLESSALHGQEFCVFGVGSSLYPSYQQAARALQSQLLAAGAHAVMPLTEADESHGVEAPFSKWLATLWGALDSSCIAGPPQRLKRTKSNNRDFVEADVIVNQELVRGDSQLSTRHVELLLPAGCSYQTGDHLEVMPRNSLELVQALASRLGVSLQFAFFLQPTQNISGPDHLEWAATASTVEWALSTKCDITSPPTTRALLAFAEFASLEAERAELSEIGSGPRYHEEISQTRLTVAEVLHLYPSVDIPLGCLIQLLPPLAPRYYSVASSPLKSARRLALCVGVVEYAAPSHAELPLRHGVVSASIKGLFEPAILQCRVRPSSFRLPEDPLVPVVCVAAGTGLAPFRGFLEERRGMQSNGVEVGPMVMFFGCRTEDDNYYADEMSEFLALQTLNDLHVAFSRTHNKVYVQHLIAEQSHMLSKMICGQDGVVGANVYVCGNARTMAKSVHQALAEIVGEAYLETMVNARRYQRDVWG